MKQITEKIYTYEDLIENKIPEEVFEVIEGIGVESMATSSLHGAKTSKTNKKHIRNST